MAIYKNSDFTLILKPFHPHSFWGQPLKNSCSVLFTPSLTLLALPLYHLLHLCTHYPIKTYALPSIPKLSSISSITYYIQDHRPLLYMHHPAYLLYNTTLNTKPIPYTLYRTQPYPPTLPIHPHHTLMHAPTPWYLVEIKGLHKITKYFR